MKKGLLGLLIMGAVSFSSCGPEQNNELVNPGDDIDVEGSRNVTPIDEMPKDNTQTKEDTFETDTLEDKYRSVEPNDYEK